MKKILIIGDIILDRYIGGVADRISPEAPVPVINVNKTEDRLGGAANVAANVASLGASPTIIAACGNDDGAKIIKKILSRKFIKHCILCFNDEQTTTKARVISGTQQIVRLDSESIVKKSNALQLHEMFRNEIVNADCVIISDYGKGAIVNANLIINEARKLGKPVLVDPKGGDFSQYTNANILKPNLKEFESIVGDVSSVSDFECKAKKLIEELSLETLIITLGADGGAVFNSDGSSYKFKNKANGVFDVSGAGDTFIASLAVSLSLGDGLRDSVDKANIAAGISVSKPGTSTVSRAELNCKSEKKILSQEDLINVVTELKEANRSIVMTNGCFDILHAGHVKYLSDAKSKGDILIVAINDDNSIGILKGIDRPINTLQSRMEVLSGLSSVDFIVPFSEKTPEALYKLVTPNVLVKGAEYAGQEIVGAEHVVSMGGSVELLPMKFGHSTTSIIHRILKK